MDADPSSLVARVEALEKENFRLVAAVRALHVEVQRAMVERSEMVQAVNAGSATTIDLLASDIGALFSIYGTLSRAIINEGL